MEKLIPYVLIPVWMALLWCVSGWIGSKVRPRRAAEQAFRQKESRLHRRGFYHPNLSTRRFLAWSAPFFAALVFFLPFAQVYRESVKEGERLSLVAVVVVFFLLLFSGISLARKRGDLSWSNEVRGAGRSTNKNADKNVDELDNENE